MFKDMMYAEGLLLSARDNAQNAKIAADQNSPVAPTLALLRRAVNKPCRLHISSPLRHAFEISGRHRPGPGRAAPPSSGGRDWPPGECGSVAELQATTYSTFKQSSDHQRPSRPAPDSEPCPHRHRAGRGLQDRDGGLRAVTTAAARAVGRPGLRQWA